MNNQPPVRIVHLSNYLRELVSDIAAQEKIVKIKGDPVQVAAVALLSGSIAVIEAMWSDISSLAGNAKLQAKTMAKPALAQVVNHGVGLLIDKLFPQR